MGTWGKLTSERSGDVLVVRASGRLDGETGDELCRLTERAGEPVVLVLREVVYISSSGIAALVRVSSRSQLRLASVPRSVQDVLGLAGVERLFSIFGDEHAALGAPR
jgi:anti-anti-sigma factor